ncbi:MAG: dimethyl sulfoxide reductase anchor subunit family protein [Brooklawnia sp.]|jgi:anaerobic dimethyl sulfoxide reductase subunit C (anchor subunit)
MELGELPMIFFTVISQMCVGAFVVLGLVQTLAGTRFSTRAVDRLADPALFAIGPAMIAGLLVSMLHMHDVFNMFNVIRHWQTSWLSREIIFGVGFAVLGFGFFILQALKIGSPMMRRVLALVTALFGIGLVVAQCQIYYALVTVPAWHSWATWVQFFGTTILLGSLLVGMAFVLVIMRRRARLAGKNPQEQAAMAAATADPDASIGQRMRDFLNDSRVDSADLTGEVDRLLTLSVRGTMALAVAAGGVLMIAMPLYISGLSAAGDQGLTSAAHYATGFAMVRFGLLVLGAFLLGLMAFYYAGFGLEKLRTLGYLMVSSFVLVLIGEFMGRYLFYEVMARVGV